MKKLPYLLLGLLMLGVGCSVPQDDSPTVLSSDLMPVRPSPTPETSGTRQRVIYLFNEETGRLQDVTREVQEPVTVQELLAELSELPTDGETAEGLVSVLTEDTLLVPSRENALNPVIVDGVMTINLQPTGLPTLEPELQLRALAQLVWTIAVRDDVNAVKINIEGEGQNWPTSGDDKSPNQNLLPADYFTLDPDFEAEPVPTPGDPIVEGETPDPG